MEKKEMEKLLAEHGKKIDNLSELFNSTTELLARTQAMVDVMMEMATGLSNVATNHNNLIGQVVLVKNLVVKNTQEIRAIKLFLQELTKPKSDKKEPVQPPTGENVNPLNSSISLDGVSVIKKIQDIMDSSLTPTKGDEKK